MSIIINKIFFLCRAGNMMYEATIIKVEKSISESILWDYKSRSG